MGADTRARRYSEHTIRQVRQDCNRAMIRARFCPQRSEVVQLRCIDDRPEQESAFGNQLWYFEGLGVDEHDRRHSVFGVVEYSIQFGLHELVEDGVFDSEYQRERFRHLYEREVIRPSWRHPAHRWLLVAVVSLAIISLAFFLSPAVRG
jgi:hypothetical protein